MIRVTYPGTNNFSTFVYDGKGRNVSIVETTAGSVTSTKQFVHSDSTRAEERNTSGVLTKSYFGYGQINGSTKYFYSRDNLGSIFEVSDTAGTLQSERQYDCFGQTSKLFNAVPPDFGYANYYVHDRSGLALTKTRAYKSELGRFLSRDPIEERAGINLYSYVNNRPISSLDPSGLQAFTPFELPIETPIEGSIEGSMFGRFPWSRFTDPIIVPQPVPPPAGTQGNPNYDCCRTVQCCTNNENRCGRACDYWYGRESWWGSQGALDNCKRCCHAKQQDCIRTMRETSKPDFQDCMEQGRVHPFGQRA